MTFQKAVLTGHNARVAIYGPSGAGKTHLALRLARALAGERGVAMLNTEGERGGHYAPLFDYDIETIDSYTQAAFVTAWRGASEGGYAALVIDSFSQFWNGEGGILEQGGGDLKSWDKVKNPIVRKLMSGVHKFPGHVVATFRSKTDFVEEVGSNGKKQFVPVGTSPVFKDGMAYEFDLLIQLEQDHRVTVLKAPPGSGLDRWVGDSLDDELMNLLVTWAKGGVE